MESLKILLIESDEGLRKLLASILEMEYNVLALASPLDGLSMLFNNYLPRLIIVSINPHKSVDLQVVKQMKLNRFTCDIPIILLLPDEQNFHEEIENNYEFEALFTKPLDLEALRQKVKEYVNVL